MITNQPEDAPMGDHAKQARALVSDNPLLLGVAAIGFSVSFQTVSRLATVHGLPGYPVLYPLGIDIGILALIVESRKAIDDGRSDLVPRMLAWLLAAFTIYVNAHGAPAHDWLGRALHVVMPALWIAFLELTRWRRLASKRKERREGIPLARWIAAPRSSLLMHRRMVLHHVTSYEVAVELEDARVFARDITRAHFGRRWRSQAPRLLRSRIRTGRLDDALMHAIANSEPWEESARKMVSKAITDGDRLTAAVKRERRQIDRSADRQDETPADRQPVRRKAARKSVSVSAEVGRLLSVIPPLSVGQIAARAGVSERTVGRVKKELAEPAKPHLVSSR